ncbi:hypothetical protein LOTGIDRAFT_236200 [Lottia gigantea]|uniref:Beta-galactosidase n=1 Tax=Lottia gigantea TaxID=225164 RepID=V3ZJV5_LOTGI|nr:hypothetical protein LOTGIDRAFT_236200 [Lottia gigantea]ESO84522.1 hypothetical protein LOTGIDRAFT_236200 [Lottia gigantea]
MADRRNSILVTFFCFISFIYICECQNDSFTIDYNGNTFILDGKPFRAISGSMHYSRTHPYYWKDRLMKMVAAGLNTVQTYVPWNIHEPTQGKYDFTGLANLELFLQTAQDVGLKVLMRSGPYICGEWEYGGLPAWLLTINPNMVVRTMDPDYIKAVDGWYDVLLPILKKYLHINGGPILMVQIENEYGSYFACDYDYLRFLYQKARTGLGEKAIIYTTDGDGDAYVKCGTVEGCYVTIDFGPTSNPASNFQVQRHFEPKGPLVNSEFYTGWLDHWGNPHAHTAIDTVCNSLDKILALGASVNMYMFEGGTNFGYWNGANAPPYQPVPTSYDYDSPLNETGDITDKYIAIRQTISKYQKLPEMPIPPNTPKGNYGDTDMNFVATVQDALSVLSPNQPVSSTYPLTMEQIKFYYGFILYRTKLPTDITTPTPLITGGVRDRGYVTIDQVPQGIFIRDDTTQVNITGKQGQYLDILVENTGRIGFATLMNYNTKGIIANVTLNGKILTDWTIYPISLENINGTTIFQHNIKSTGPKKNKGLQTPSIFIGKIPIPASSDEPKDTFLDPTNWTKGQALVNGFNLGRYWPVMGPQVTLYVPKPVLKEPSKLNYLVVLELENTTCTSSSVCKISFTDIPVINKIPPGFHSNIRNIPEGYPYHKRV